MHAAIKLNRAGWVRAARAQGLTSLQGVADSMGLDVAHATELWTGEVAPNIEFIARSLKIMPAKFDRLFIVP